MERNEIKARLAEVAVQHEAASARTAERQIQRRRLELQETTKAHRMSEITGIVTHLVEYLDLLETTHGPAWAAIDELVAKVTKLEESAKRTVESHASLLRRTIAINIEYELKRELLECAASDTEPIDEDAILKVTIDDALIAAKTINRTRAMSIISEWFPDNIGYSLKNFKASMELLKLASGDIHPTKDLDGNPIELSQAKDLVREDFEIPSNSRKAGRKWTQKDKDLAVYYLEKLWVIRVENGPPCFLLA